MCVNHKWRSGSDLVELLFALVTYLMTVLSQSSVSSPV